MRPTRRERGSLLATVPAAAITLVALAATACIGAVDVPDPWRTWTRLELKAHAIPLFSGRVEWNIDDTAGHRVLETRTIARFFGAKIADSRSRTVFDPDTGLPKRYSSRDRKRGRDFRFGKKAYTYEKLTPTDDGDASDGGGFLDGMTVTETREFDYPLDEDGTPIPVFDYYGMILHLGDVGLDAPGDEATIWVATTDGPEAYSVRVSEVRREDYSWRDLETDKKRTENVRLFRLRIAPADPDESDEGFLNMEGETELWVESGSKTLLYIGGKIPKIPGRVRLLLDALG